MSDQVRGKVVIVTGAASGFGRLVAEKVVPGARVSSSPTSTAKGLMRSRQASGTREGTRSIGAPT
jgi:NAD(P)-dependent dehydrogenase (short-subunit alcohol dehydrogenase family)